MAGVSKMADKCIKAGSGMMVAMLMVMVMQAVAVVGTGAQPAELKLADCSTSDEYVYPFQSLCDDAAEEGEGYHFNATLGLQGALAPEFDETNVTYYVRLSDSGATYGVVLVNGGPLLLNYTVFIGNPDSHRVLAWRQEGTEEYFLIEKDVSSFIEGAPFRFLLADDVDLACPAQAQCHAYYLTSNPSGDSWVGLQTYEEDNVTYIKAAADGSTGNLPIVLIKLGNALSYSS